MNPEGVVVRLNKMAGVVTVIVDDWHAGLISRPAITTQAADALARKLLPGARLVSTGGTVQTTPTRTLRQYRRIYSGGAR
jgi:hypothetical protein